MTTDMDYKFRYKLKCLSDKLTPSDLDNLKGLCSGHVNVENITSGIALWRGLQDSGKLGVNNLDYLKLLFTSIGKLHLFENVFSPIVNGESSQINALSQQTSNTGCNQQERNCDTVLDHSIQRDSEYHFRYKLKYISDKLSPGDFETIKVECQDHIGAEKLEKMTSTIQLWKELQDCNIIGVNKIEFLEQLLRKINKHRLLEEVFTPPPSNGVGLPLAGPAAPSNRLDSHENIGSLATMYPYSLVSTESIDGYTSAPQNINVTSTQLMTQEHPQAYKTMYPADDQFPQYEVNTTPSIESNHGYNQAYPLLDAYYHPVCTLTPPPPLPPTYDMNQSPHGTCIVVSNYHFTEHRDRKGTRIDEQRLFHLFTYLGYNVEVKKDLNSQQMKDYLNQVANREEHDAADSFVCCILSHGDNGKIYGSDSRLVDIDDLVMPFKGNRCRKLVSKPKMFFIQSCRGNTDDEMVEIYESDGPKAVQEKHTLPSEADFFFGFGTTRGYASYRSTKDGSWYIKNLYEVMMEYSQHSYDLLTMHTIVNQFVSEMTAGNQPFKQCSAPVSTLRKRVIFK